MTCFSAETLITTDMGEIPAHMLRPGDMVLTRDHDYQPVRWVGLREMAGRFLLDNPHLRPVLVRTAAFGNDLPVHDVMLAPNARLPLDEPVLGTRALERPGHEQMVAIKHLINHHGIQQIDMVGLRYAHVMFDSHQVIAANGFWVESFCAGDYSLGARGNAQRNEIFEIFPELRRTQSREVVEAGAQRGAGRSAGRSRVRALRERLSPLLG